MGVYTIKEYQAKLTKIASSVDLFDKALFIAAKSAQSEMVERIFEDGKDANGNQIGQYNNTKELYMSDDNSPIAGNHLGKPNAEGKRKKIKTSYYENYRTFRKKQGRESGKVNLRLFGRLQSDFANAPVSKGNLSYAIAVSKDSLNKIQGNEFRFGKKIFIHSLAERKVFSRVFKFEVGRLLNL